MHQVVLDLYYNNYIWCETKFYLLQLNILMWNKCLLIATTLFWCETRFNFYNNTFRCYKVILAIIFNRCNTFKLLLKKIYIFHILRRYIWMWNKWLLIASINFKINSSTVVNESVLQSFLRTHEYLLKPSSNWLISIWIYSKPHIFLPNEYINEGKC